MTILHEATRSTTVAKPQVSTGNEVDPVASAEQRKARNAELWPEENMSRQRPIEQRVPR
jgi:hypothetical protein